jgi:hypothetical protein
MRINPKNFYQRELDQLPPHFVNTVVRAHDSDIEKMKLWIYEHCTGRYSITKDVKIKGDVSKAVTVLGFEDPGDLVLFSLSGTIKY